MSRLWRFLLIWTAMIVAGSVASLMWLLRAPHLEEFLSFPIPTMSEDETLVIEQPLETQIEDNRFLLASRKNLKASLHILFTKALLEGDFVLGSENTCPIEASSSQILRPPPTCSADVEFADLPCKEESSAICSNDFFLWAKDPNNQALKLRFKPATSRVNEKELKLQLELEGSKLETVLSTNFQYQEDEDEAAGGNQASCDRKLWSKCIEVRPLESNPSELKVVAEDGSEVNLTFLTPPGSGSAAVEPFSVSDKEFLLARSLKVEAKRPSDAPLLEVEGPEGERQMRIERLELQPGLLQVRISGKGKMTGSWAPRTLKMMLKERRGESIAAARSLAIGGLGLAAFLFWLGSRKPRPEQKPPIDSKLAGSGQRVQVFVSYADEDYAYLKGDSLLGVLKESDELLFWSDEKFKGSDIWDKEIKRQIEQSEIVLALVSEHFLASEYCMKVEVPRFLKKSKSKRIFPVMLSPCEWRRYKWLRERHHLPEGDKTIKNNFTDPVERKLLFERIQRELEELARPIREARDQEASSSSSPPPVEPSKPVDDASP